MNRFSWMWIKKESKKGDYGARALVKLAQETADSPSNFAGKFQIKGWLNDLGMENGWHQIVSELETQFYNQKNLEAKVI